jgi:Domain of unknown function (DUF5664)
MMKYALLCSEKGCYKRTEPGRELCAEHGGVWVTFVSPAPPVNDSVSTEGASSKATTTNPKDLLGVKKVSLTKLPAVAALHAAHALMDGAVKYGPYNWRDKAVQADIYIDACLRHVNAWFDGEETAADSGVHHLGHAMACLAIILDAQEAGKLVDNRPVKDGGRGIFARVLERLNGVIAGRK